MTRISRLDARRILDGRDRSGRLGALLDAAAAPPRPQELGGEDTVLAAFSAAPRQTASPARRFLARIVIIKTVVAMTLLGGVALAASSSLTGDDAGSPNSAVSEAGLPEPAPNTPVDPKTTSPFAPGDTGSPTKGPEEHEPITLERLTELCRLFLDDPGVAQEEKDYSRLEHRAGGLDRVRRFCQRLVNNGEDQGGDENNGRPGTPSTEDPKTDGPQDGTSPMPLPSPKPTKPGGDDKGREDDQGGKPKGDKGNKGLSALSYGTYVG